MPNYPSTETIVRQAFKAYETGDGESLHTILSDNFTFSSPPDPRLDRDGYLLRCWPFHEHKPCFKFEEFFVRGDHALVLYSCKHNAGPDLMNAEYYVVRDGKLVSVTVFFGPGERAKL